MGLFLKFISFSSFYLLSSELQRKGKSEDKNTAVSVNKAEDVTRIESKQDLGKESSSDNVNNCEIQGHDTNSSKCKKTETESAALGNSSEETETNKEQEMGSSSAVGKDIPVQKKRKRCWTCKAKLELAQRELGNCRCSKYWSNLTCKLMTTAF